MWTRFHFLKKCHDSCTLLNLVSSFRRFKWIRIRIQDFNDQNWHKITAWKNLSFFDPKIAIYLSLGPLKGHPELQKMQFGNFLNFCGSFLPSWIRILRPNWIRIRIHNTGTYPVAWTRRPGQGMPGYTWSSPAGPRHGLPSPDSWRK